MTHQGWFSRKEKSSRRSRRQQRQRRLRFETLENRRVLATNMASIAGFVFDDTDSDGIFEPGAGEVGIFTEKAVARMNSSGARFTRRVEDIVCHEVRLADRPRAEPGETRSE